MDPTRTAARKRTATALLTTMALALLALAATAFAFGPLRSWGEGGTGEATLGTGIESLAVDPFGNVYVADTTRAAVKAFTNDGTFLLSWAIPAMTPRHPGSVAVGADGDIYVASRGHIARFSPVGAPDGGWDLPGSDSDEGRVGGLAATAAGNLLVADRWHGRVLRFALDGTLLDTFGAASLSDPRGIAESPDGSIYVADHTLDAVVHLSAGGTRLGSWHVADPHGVAVDSAQQIYVAQSDQGPIARFSADGTPKGTIGAGELHDPRGLAVDCRDALYVADSSAQRIHIYGDAGVSPPCVAPAVPDAAAPVAPPMSAVLGASAESGPVLGVSFRAERVSGKVTYRAHGASSFTALTGRPLLPMGTRLDTTSGRVRLTLATAAPDRATYGPTQSGVFHGGVFDVFQSTTATLTELELAGSEPVCAGGAAKPARASAKPKRKRGVWGDAKGKFRTTGSHGAATVRGTKWFTEDRCDGTLVKVQRGLVGVEDFEAKKTVDVAAGQEYLAAIPCTSRRRFSVHINVPPGVQVRGIRMTVNGRAVAVKRSALSAEIDLRGRPKGSVTVRIVVTTTTGLALSGTRRYLTCAEKQSSPGPSGLR